MKILMNGFTRIAIVISVYSYFTVGIMEIFHLDLESNVLSAWSLKIGLFGLAYIVQKGVMVALPQVKEFFVEEDFESDSDQMRKIAQITFTIGSFLLSLMAVAGSLMIVKGYNILNELDFTGYLGLLISAVLLTILYKKWCYPEEFEAIGKN